MKTLNICDFGARFCDELQTEAIQKAIDACFWQAAADCRPYDDDR